MGHGPWGAPNVLHPLVIGRGDRSGDPTRVDRRAGPGQRPRRQAPAAFFRASTRSVRSQVKSGSSRPKWPYAAVWA